MAHTHPSPPSFPTPRAPPLQPQRPFNARLYYCSPSLPPCVHFGKLQPRAQGPHLSQKMGPNHPCAPGVSRLIPLPGLGDPRRRTLNLFREEEVIFLLGLGGQSSGPLTTFPPLQHLGRQLPPIQTFRSFPTSGGGDWGGAQESQVSLFPREPHSSVGTGARERGAISLRDTAFQGPMNNSNPELGAPCGPPRKRVHILPLGGEWGEEIRSSRCGSTHGP